MKNMIAVLVFFLALNVQAVSEKGFVLNVLQNNEAVREIVEDGKLRVAIPFDVEYKLRLKNVNARRCTARIKIDGTLVSKLGDVVLNANGCLDLERFIDASLAEGKRFKFVSLDNPKVDDPSREENGLVEVEFRLEKTGQIQIIEQPPILFFQLWPTGIIYSINNTFNCSATPCSVTLPGATIEGSQSMQSFSKVNLEMEDDCVVLKLWLCGIKQ